MNIDPNWQTDQIIFDRIAFGLFSVAVILLGFTANEFRRRQSGRPNLFLVLLCYTLGFIFYGSMVAVMAATIQQPHKPVLLLRSLQAVSTLVWVGATAVLYRDLSRREREDRGKQY